jgi:hypothetical protein
MKIFSIDGSVLMDIKSVERNGKFIELRGTIMGSMPVKARLQPAEARKGLRFFKHPKWWWFLLTFVFR